MQPYCSLRLDWLNERWLQREDEFSVSPCSRSEEMKRQSHNCLVVHIESKADHLWDHMYDIGRGEDAIDRPSRSEALGHHVISHPSYGTPCALAINLGEAESTVWKLTTGIKIEIVYFVLNIVA
jgi:hypothetical protein